MAKLFSVSDEFRLLCIKVGITPSRIDVTPIYTLHKNFAMILLLTSTRADIFCNCFLPIFHCVTFAVVANDSTYMQKDSVALAIGFYIKFLTSTVIACCMYLSVVYTVSLCLSLYHSGE